MPGQRVDELEHRHRLVIADVEDLVQWHVGLGRAEREANHAFDDVVDVGEVALQSAAAE